MTVLFQRLKKWLHRLFCVAVFSALVGIIGFASTKCWDWVLVTKPSFAQYTIEVVETIFDANRRKLAELARERYDRNESILNAIDSYQRQSEDIFEQRAKLKRNIGTVPIEKAIQMFEDKANIPQELLPAYSTWKALVQREQERLKLLEWLDEQEQLDILGDIEKQMIVVRNYIDLGKIMDASQMDSLDRLIESPIKGISEDSIGEQRAIESLRESLVPQSRQVIFITSDDNNN